MFLQLVEIGFLLDCHSFSQWLPSVHSCCFFVSFFFNLYLRLPSFVIFFLCTEILGLLRYGNTWKETSDMKTKSRFHYHTYIYKLNNVQRHANFSDKSLTVMMRSISRSQFELITEFSGLCLFLCRPSM